MLEILTTVLTSSISKLFDTLVENILERKRSMSIKFIELFSSLLELERSSKEVFHEIQEIAETGKILSKVVLKKKFERFFKNYESFVHKLREIQSKLSILDNDLLIKLEGLRASKQFNAKILDLMLEVCPRPVVEDGHFTTLIIYPTKYPSEKLIENRSFPDATQDDLEREIKKIKKQIINKLEFQTIDIAAPKEGRILLENTARGIQAIENLRVELADFIKRTFPLDEILQPD